MVGGAQTRAGRRAGGAGDWAAVHGALHRFDSPKDMLAASIALLEGKGGGNFYTRQLAPKDEAEARVALQSWARMLLAQRRVIRVKALLARRRVRRKALVRAARGVLQSWARMLLARAKYVLE